MWRSPMWSDAVEVGRGAGHPPGPVEAPGGEATLLSPSLEGLSRGGVEGGLLPEAGRFELSVEAALAFELTAPGGDDTRSRTGAEDSPVGSEARASRGTRRTPTFRSMRSSRGPDSLR